jgi:hypothetical protein
MKLTLGAIISLVGVAVQEYPAVAAELKDIFTKENATPADWSALHDKINSMTYENLVPDSELPRGPSATV